MRYASTGNKLARSTAFEKEKGNTLSVFDRPMSGTVTPARKFTKHKRQKSAVYLSGVGGKLKKLDFGLSVCGMSVKQHVKASNPANPFEMVPKTYEPKLVHWTNMNMKGMMAKESLIFKEAKKKKDLPGPTAYAGIDVWSNLSKTDNMQKLSKSKILSFTDQIVKREKNLPAPNKYNPKLQYKVQQVPKSDTLQMMMVENSRYYGQCTPGAQYKLNHQWTESRPKSATYYPRIRTKGQQVNKERGVTAHHTKKSKDPAPGSYNVRESLERAVDPNRNWEFKKGPKVNCVEEYAKRKSKVPGVGKYEKADNQIKNLSKPVMSMRRSRQ